MNAKEFFNKRAIKHQLKRAINKDYNYFQESIIQLMEEYAATRSEWVSVEERLKKWSKIYDFNFQFWDGSNSVFITKHDVDIYNTGGYATIDEVIAAAVNWCEKVNKSKVR